MKDGDSDVILGVTENLKMHLQQRPDLFNEVKACIQHYVDEYRRVGAITKDRKSLAHSFHNAMNKLIEEGTRGVESQLSCKAGCAHCCYVNVDITEDEAELLLYAIAEKGIVLDEQKLIHQAKAERWNQIAYKDRRCPLLGQNNECMVYEHRPMSCRKYFVRSPPEKCNSQKYPAGDVEVLSMNFAECMASALFSTVPTDRLSRMLLKKMK